jgi:plastocyanin
MRGLLTSSNSLRYFLFALLLLTAVPSNAPAATFHVSVVDDRFSPSGLDAGEEVTIHVGDTVVWTLKSPNSHNIEEGDFLGHTCTGEGLSHTFIGAGDKYSHTFNAPVDCYYKCNIHPPEMLGLIHVIGGAPATGAAPEKKGQESK